MSAIEIHISAERLASRFGHRAWKHAADHAESFAATGDWEKVAVWRRIGAAIRELERQSAVNSARPSVVRRLVGGYSAMFLGNMPSENSALCEA